MTLPVLVVDMAEQKGSFGDGVATLSPALRALPLFRFCPTAHAVGYVHAHASCAFAHHLFCSSFASRFAV